MEVKLAKVAITAISGPNHPDFSGPDPHLAHHPISKFIRHSSARKGLRPLQAVRHSLIRHEDNIIFSLLERAQYCYNEDTYACTAFSMEGFPGSLVEFMVGKYNSPDEHPFFPAELPEPLLPPLRYPQTNLACSSADTIFRRVTCQQVLHQCADSININKKVWDMYFRDLLPRLVKSGDDGNYGLLLFVTQFVCRTGVFPVKQNQIFQLENLSSALTRHCGIDANGFNATLIDNRFVWALSKRIHYGKLWQRQNSENHLPATRLPLDCKSSNSEESKDESKTYGQEVRINEEEDAADPIYKIKPSLVASPYGDWIMPLTKEVQVEYFLR
ncbi:hypothetical protein RJ639_002404, partial [Escallonia herrerae]